MYCIKGRIKARRKGRIKVRTKERIKGRAELRYINNVLFGTSFCTSFGTSFYTLSFPILRKVFKDYYFSQFNVLKMCVLNVACSLDKLHFMVQINYISLCYLSNEHAVFKRHIFNTKIEKNNNL